MKIGVGGSLVNSFGSQYSGGDIYMAHNSVQSAYNTDSWEISYPIAASVKLSLGGASSGLAFYVAPPVQPGTTVRYT